VITGHGIKFVKQMKEDPKILIELEKLEIATQYLRGLGLL